MTVMGWVAPCKYTPKVTLEVDAVHYAIRNAVAPISDVSSSSASFVLDMSSRACLQSCNVTNNSV